MSQEPGAEVWAGDRNVEIVDMQIVLKARRSLGSVHREREGRPQGVPGFPGWGERRNHYSRQEKWYPGNRRKTKRK